MQLYNFQNALNFKGALININALSDTHGHIELMDKAYQTLDSKDAFVKEEKGNANYLIFGGDYFISGNKTGFKTNPNKPLEMFQLEMYNAFIDKIKEKFPSLKSIFVIGNHDTDCGKKLFKSAINDIKSDVIVSNLDLEKENEFKDLILENKIINSKVDFIPDDTNSEMVHPVLNLGVTPINLQYYQNEFKDLKLYDNINESKTREYQKTLEKITAEINQFKEIYPNGTVILTSHTGLDFADECAKNSDIDVIFNCHEHKDGSRIVNNTPIIEMGQNFEKIVNVKIKKDDFGSTESISYEILKPNELKDYNEGELTKYYKTIFKKDLEKTYTIKSTDKNLKELTLKNIRFEENQLANFVTDLLLRKIKQVDNSVQIFALNTSSFRGGFNLSDNKPSISPFEVSNCLDGLNPKQADIVVNEVSGDELLYMVLDNFLFNEKDKNRNTIIQYSGLKIDKTNLMKAYKDHKPLKELYKYIILDETNEPIKSNKTYKIANPEKYFIKAHDDKIKKMFLNSYRIGLNTRNAFDSCFMENTEIIFTPDKRLY